MARHFPKTNGNDPEELPFADHARRVVHYWFVQYNPLYFFSALCVLAGVFLVTKGLADLGWKQGQIILATVMQVYEILLIAGAALLFRKAGQHRPAVILGIMEVFFLFDCTFQTEMAAGLGGLGLAITLAWIVLLVFKLRALTWVFHLKVPLTLMGLLVLAAAGLAGIPHALETGGVYKLYIHLAGTSYGVILALAVLWLKPRVECELDLDEWGQFVLKRSVKAALAMWSGFYFFHLVTWATIYTIPFDIGHIAPFFLFWFFARREGWTWAAAAIILFLSTDHPAVVAPAALIMAAAFTLKARQTNIKRLYVGTVLCLFTAAWTIGWKGAGPPPINIWLNLLTAAVLAVMAWRYRLITAGIAAALVLLPIARNLVPKTLMQWGITIIAVGFIALIAGVAVNWRLGKAKKETKGGEG